MELTTDDGCGLRFDAQGRIVGLTVNDRPAPVRAVGGWEVWDEAAGGDETFRVELDDEWPAGNEWLRDGSMWRFGTGWEEIRVGGREHPVALWRSPEPSHGDALRLAFPAPAGAVLTIAVDLRTESFRGRLRAGAVPVNAVGRPANGWVPFDPALPPDGEWGAITCVIAPPATTTAIEVYLAGEEASGTIAVGGASITVHSGARKLDLEARTTASPGCSTVVATGEGVTLSAEYRALADHLTARAQIEATGEEDRALTLVFRVPLGGEGWYWWDDLRTRRSVPTTGGRLFFNWRHLDGGHLYSPYPLACVTRDAPAAALALAAPPGQAVLQRFAFRAEGGLTAAFDVGLAPRLGQRSAAVEVAIYAADVAWGLRAALHRYYILYADGLRPAGEHAGAWFTAVNPELVPNPAVFGLLFDEQATDHLAWSRANRLLSLTYFDPWGQSGDGTGPANGALWDANGQEVVRRDPAGAAYRPWSTDPALLPDGPAGLINAWLAGRLETAEGALGGVVLDGIGARERGWQVDDYRPEHLAASDLPLAHSKATRRPVVYSAIAHTAWLRETSRRLRRADRLILGALDSEALLPFVVPWLDVLATGVAPDDDQLMWLRSLAYHKPVTFLDPRILDPTTMPDEQLRLWRRCLLWGVFPGSAGWLSPRVLQSVEPLFRAYVPVLRELAAAGWEPVTYATVNDAAIELERFGYRDNAHLVLVNPTTAPRVVTLTVQPQELGLVTYAPDGMPMRRAVWMDRLSRTRRAIEFDTRGERWHTTLALPAGSVRVLSPYAPGADFEAPFPTDLGIGMAVP